MSQDDIERLIAERSLSRETFDDDQIVGFWTKALTSYADARVPGISADGAFQSTYTACLQATFAILAASGLRVRSTAGHYKAFYALQKLDVAALRPFAIRFDEFRVTRHESIYEPVEDEAEISARLAEALTVLADAFPTVHTWLIGKRPGLGRRLAT